MENSEEFKAGFVAVIGRPNVGKSTLMNTFLGQKIAAVTPRPQTTRTQQLGILTLDNAQLIFTDTPGIHHAKHKLGKYMNEEAIDIMADSDVVLFLVDVSVPPHEEDLLIAKTISTTISRLPVLLVMNKADMAEADELESLKDAYQAMAPNALPITISALNQENIPALLDMIAEKLPENPPFFDEEQITDRTERDISADLIREAALIILRDEVPHGIAVRIDEFTERGDKGAYIEATLFVERDSQKGIVIGKGGEMIKRISTHARQEIEAMSERKVFLRMRVKVRKNWRNNENVLRQFGFRGKK